MLAIRPVRVSFFSPLHATWTEGTEGGYPYLSGEIDDVKFGAWARTRSPEVDGRGFTWTALEAEGDSDIGSPPLWKNGGSPVSPHEGSRANARYQQEMLDMVREVSESNYELSMKDLVELSLRKGPPLKEKELMMKTKNGSGKGAEKSPRAVRKLLRAESMEHGVFLLKMFSPFPGGWGRSSGTGNTSSKGSPKPDSSHKRRILDRLRAFLFGKSYSSSYRSRK